MEYRTLGKTGWRVSTVSMGCWNIGGQWGEVGEEAARATLHRSLDRGVNLFDTADAYGTIPGQSEEILGRTFRGMRDRVILASKAGNYARRAEAPLSFTSWLHVKLCCEATLFRLKTDYLDLLQCHLGGASEAETEVFLEGFARLKEAGLIRAWGVSTNSVEVLRRFNASGECASCQLDYSLLNRTPEKDLLPYCGESQIGTLVRGPLAQGLLAGKFSRDHRFTDTVREGWNDGPGRERFLQRLESVDRLRFLATGSRTLAQAALQYVLTHPAVSCAIPGAKSPEQAAANAGAADGALSPEELERARAAVGGA
jgi:aryl-alcohol dehydrogenase-like predicted oxidoreductase